MAEHQAPDQQAPPDESIVQLGHEPDQVGVTRLSFALAGLLGLMMLSIILCYGIVQLLTREEPVASSTPLPSRVRGDVTPPAPNIDPNQAYERALQTSRKREVLDSFGWVDPQQDVAHIPIEQAMEIVAERGLAPWQPAAAPRPSEKEPARENPAEKKPSDEPPPPPEDQP